MSSAELPKDPILHEKIAWELKQHRLHHNDAPCAADCAKYDVELAEHIIQIVTNTLQSEDAIPDIPIVCGVEDTSDLATAEAIVIRHGYHLVKTEDSGEREPRFCDKCGASLHFQEGHCTFDSRHTQQAFDPTVTDDAAEEALMHFVGANTGDHLEDYFGDHEAVDAQIKNMRESIEVALRYGK